MIPTVRAHDSGGHLIWRPLPTSQLKLLLNGGTSRACVELMFGTECLRCGVKLGNYLYADACPRCHELLKRNLADPTPVHATVATARSWPVRAFFGIRDFVES
jgi:hypothetical protein